MSDDMRENEMSERKRKRVRGWYGGQSELARVPRAYSFVSVYAPQRDLSRVRLFCQLSQYSLSSSSSTMASALARSVIARRT